MASHNPSPIVDQNRIIKAEFTDARGDLLNLLLGVSAGVAFIGSKLINADKHNLLVCLRDNAGRSSNRSCLFYLAFNTHFDIPFFLLADLFRRIGAYVHGPG